MASPFLDDGCGLLTSRSPGQSCLDPSLTYSELGEQGLRLKAKTICQSCTAGVPACWLRY